MMLISLKKMCRNIFWQPLTLLNLCKPTLIIMLMMMLDNYTYHTTAGLLQLKVHIAHLHHDPAGHHYIIQCSDWFVALTNT